MEGVEGRGGGETERLRETERATERDREIERDRERQRETEKDIERDRDGQPLRLYQDEEKGTDFFACHMS